MPTACDTFRRDDVTSRAAVRSGTVERYRGEIIRPSYPLGSHIVSRSFFFSHLLLIPGFLVSGAPVNQDNLPILLLLTLWATFPPTLWSNIQHTIAFGCPNILSQSFGF